MSDLGMSATVVRLAEHSAPEPVREAIDAIFFETSNAQQFASGPEREAFRERWLGRYLAHYPDEAFLAVAGGEIVGYLVGCLEDPARNTLFADIPYFAEFAHLSRRFPAHLHINLTAAWRGRGIGVKLIEAFAAHARRAGAPGMHVVTAEGARNNHFYMKCGFRQLAVSEWGGKRVAFLGRSLDPSGSNRGPDLSPRGVPG